MRKITLAILALLLLSWNNNILSQDFITSKIKVKVKTNNAKLINDIKLNYNLKGIAKTGIKDLDIVFKNFEATNFTPLFPRNTKYERRHKEFGLDLWYIIEIKEKGKSIIQNLKSELDKTNLFEITEYYYTKRINVMPKSSIQQNMVFNDPRFDEQWHYENTGQTGGTNGADISLTEAWSVETGSDDVIVAIIDGGIDHNHPDLTNGMWINVQEQNGTIGVDDDSNGYIDDIYGYNFSANIGSIEVHPHGTHVAGTIGAINNNNIGVSGIAGGSDTNGGVRLMSCQTFTSTGGGGFDAAFVYAADNGAIIAQNSWGYTSPGNFEQSVLDAIDYFIANAGYDAGGNPIGRMQGGLVVFAAGNDDQDAQWYPGYYDPVFTVAATNHNDQKSWYSNFGDWVDIAAPGGETNITEEGVLSTLPGNSYGFYQGTSMACPHVSGVAALVVSNNTNLTADGVKQALLLGSDYIDDLNASYIGKLGQGRINAFNSLSVDVDTILYPINDLEINYTSFNNVIIQWTAQNNFSSGKYVSGYDIRYSTSLINNNNFDNATRIAYTSSPGDSLEAELFSIENLEATTEYFFAVKAIGILGNTSNISNIISVTTNNPPIIDISITEIIDTLVTGESSEHTIEISNIGESNLIYTISATYNSNLKENKDYIVNIFSNNSEILIENSSTKLIYKPDFSKKIYSGKSEMNILVMEAVNGSYHYDNALNNLNLSRTLVTNATALDSELNNGTNWDLVIVNSYSTSISDALITEINDYLESGGKLIFADWSVYKYVSNKLLLNMGIDFVSSITTPINVQGVELAHSIFNFPNQIENLFYTDNQATIDGQIVNILPNATQLAAFEGYSNSGAIVLNASSNSIYNGFQSINFNADTDTDGKLDIIELIENQIGFLLGTARSWLTTDIISDTILPGTSQDIMAILNATGLNGGEYIGNLLIESNDPITTNNNLPITLEVIGAPHINIENNTVILNEVFINNEINDSVLIENIGTDTLEISSILWDITEFNCILNNRIIPPGEEEQLFITFNSSTAGSFTDTIQIKSNSYVDSLSYIEVFAEALMPPILVTSYDTIIDTLYTGQEVVHLINIDNTSGGSNLYTSYFIDSFGYQTSKVISKAGPFSYSLNKYLTKLEASNLPVVTKTVFSDKINSNSKSLVTLLESDLAKLDSNYQKITSLIPNRYNFLGGETGTYISDGGGDMYDSGNLLYIETNGPLSYTNGQIITSAYMGAGSEGYFTKKYEGLFIFEANLDNISSFKIDGGLGADGSGNVDETVLSIDYQGKNYTGFVKRVYNTSDPSVNHLIIIENSSAPVHNISTNTNNDLDEVTNINDVEKIYYLLYAGQSGYYIDDIATLAIMEKFVEIISTSSNWINLDCELDTISAGNSKNLKTTFNSDYLKAGNYSARINIQSNDPNNLISNIPIKLNVIAAPSILIEEDTVTFPEIFINQEIIDSIMIGNIGTDTLEINTISWNETSFTCLLNDSTIAPGENKYLMLSFISSTAGSFSDSIEIRSNSVSDSILNFELLANAILPPIILVSPDSIVDSLFTGQIVEQSFYIDNTSGGSNLSFSISGGNVSVDTTSTQYYTTTGETTYHNFNNLSRNVDTLFLTITLNGDYTTSSEFATLSIEGTTIGRINENGFSDGSDYSKTYAFSGAEITDWLLDNNLYVSIINCSEVNPGYGEQLNKVQLFTKGENWFSPSINKGNVDSGNSTEVVITFDATGLYGGDYSSNLKINSNDPVNPEIILPVDVHITGIPEIAISKYDIDFGPVFVNYSYTDTVTISNIGTDLLVVNNILSDNPKFIVDTTYFGLNPDDSLNIVISYSPTVVAVDSGIFSIYSNDSTNLILEINLSGEGILPPQITVNPDSISVNLFTGDSTTSYITIDNTVGGSDLYFSIKTSDLQYRKVQTLAHKISNIVFNTSTQRDVEEIVAVKSINDTSVLIIQNTSAWGVNMYDFLLTNFNVSATVINSSQISSSDFAQYKLIITVSNENNTYYNEISSNRLKFENFVENGGIVHYQLATHGANVNLVGNINALYGNQENINTSVMTDHPILEGLPAQLQGNSANHCYFSTLPANTDIITETTNSNMPTTIEYIYGKGVVIATGMTWEYLYNSGYTSAPLLLNSINYALSLLNNSSWYSIDFISDTIPSGSSINIPIKFNAYELYGGDYNSIININSNDPVNPEINIPIHLHVTPIPMISVLPELINYGIVYTNYSKTDTFIIYNNGTDTLDVNNILSDNSVYSFDITTCNIAPKKEQTIIVTFAPENESVENGIVTILSNDPDDPIVTVNISGEGLVPPQISINPDTLNATILTNSSKNDIFTIDNINGGSELNYNISIQQNSYDTTSIQYYSSTGETTYHLFDNLNPNIDSIMLVITLNGDYTSSSEYASLSIEGSDLGIINETGFTDGTDFIKTYSLGGIDVLNWLSDNLLEVTIINNSEVNPGYGEQLNKVQLNINGSDWLTVSTVEGNISVGNSEQISVIFNSNNLNIGEYTTNLKITSNDPAKTVVDVPVLLNVVNNRCPVVTNPISDQTIYITENVMKIDISTVFSDPDGDDLFYSTSSDNLNIAVASITQDTLTIEHIGVGMTQIHLFVSDGLTETVETTFSIVILDNTKPEVITNINNQTLNLPGDPLFFNLNTIFHDPDGDELFYNVVSSDELVAKSEINGSIITVSQVDVGYSTISIFANDGKSQGVYTSFIMTVISQSSPVVINPVSDKQTYITESDIIIDFSNVFSDPNGDSLAFTVTTSDNTIANSEISGNNLIIHQIGIGETVVSLTATDGLTETVETTFNVVVLDNSKPEVNTNINDQTLNLPGDPLFFNLNTVFHDPDGDVLFYSVVSSDKLVVNSEINGSILTVSQIDIGYSIITIFVTDGKSQGINISFTATVISQSSPEIINPISDKLTYVTESDIIIDFSNVFLDPNGDSLKFTVTTTDNTIANGEILGNNLIIHQMGIGETDISLTASDNITEVVTNSFTVSILVNNPPAVISEIENQTINLQGEPLYINLDGVFNDVDDDQLFYTVQSNDSSISVGSVNGSMLIVSQINVGTSVITVFANDGKSPEVPTSFIITVAATTAINNIISDLNLSLRNYPNPFNDKTKIVYYLINDAKVQLKVYTIQGVLCKVLIDQTQIKGEKYVEFDASDFSSGIYIYRLKIDNKIYQIGKMIKK